MEGLAMFGKRFLLTLAISFVLSAVANAQQGGTNPPSHPGHAVHDVCKTHPNLPQCK